MENIQNQIEGQQNLVTNSEVKRLLDNVQEQREAAETLRMLPAYVRGFFEDAAPLLGYRIEGDIETTFTLKPCPDFVEDVIEKYPGEQGQLTFSRELALPTGVEKPAAIFVHPGESIFDTIRTQFLEKYNAEGDRGAVYFDPQTDESYLFYLVRIPIVRKIDETSQNHEDMLVGIKRFADGRCAETPAHLLLTLIPRTTKQSISTALSSDWVNLAEEVESVKTFVRDDFGLPQLSDIHNQLEAELAIKRKQIQVSNSLRKAELIRLRGKLKDAVSRGVPAAQTKLNNCNHELEELDLKRQEAETKLIEEIENTQLGPVHIHVRAFVTPPPVEAAQTRTLRDAETIAINTALEYEQDRGAEVKDVSNPNLKKGFDLQSRYPNGEVRYIEVKGRTGVTNVELTANEWRQAANHRNRYWLYVVYNCDTEPKLYRCHDPFGKLIAKARGSFIINASDIINNQEL